MPGIERRGQGVGGDGIDESAAPGFGGVEFFSGEEHLQRAGLADEPRQSLRAAPSGDEAKGGPAVSEDGVRPGDAALAGEGEVEASTHAVAVYGGDCRGGEVGDGLHQALPHLREAVGLGAVELGDLVQVGARGEEVGIASNDQARRRSLGEFCDGLSEGSDAGAGETVGAVGGDKAEHGSVAESLDGVERFVRLWRLVQHRAG